MTPQETYQKKVENFVDSIYQKYVRRNDIYEPLSKILPNYWNDIFLSAVKKVMFKRVNVLPTVENAPLRYAWVMHTPSKSSKDIAKQIIEYERSLKKMIYRKNDWGDPFYYERSKQPQIYSPIGFEYKKVDGNGTIYMVSLMDFKRKYIDVFKRLCISVEVADALIESIYRTVNDAFVSGNDKAFSEGVKAAKRTQSTFDTDRLVDIYNNIELANDELKKLIDE